MNNDEFTKSSGNVFADIGSKNPEEMLAKANMAIHISNIIQKRKLSQKEAAEILGIDQPRVSDLIRGRVRRFSTDKLFSLLRVLGQDVEIKIVPRNRKIKAGNLRVVTEKKAVRS